MNVSRPPKLPFKPTPLFFGVRLHSHVNCFLSSMKSLLIDSINTSPISPVLSICIPTYKREAKLSRALKSAVAQTSSRAFPYEIVVVDNDSLASFSLSDLLTGIRLNQYSGLVRVSLYRNSTNLGAAGNWNQCLHLARGCYFSILCDDDLLYSSWLICSEYIIAQHPNIKAFGFKSIHANTCDNINLAKAYQQPSIHRISLYQIFQGSPFSGVLSVVIEKSTAFKFTFLAAASIGNAGDYLLLVKLYNNFPIYASKLPLALYNIVDNSSSCPINQAQFIPGQYCARTVLINGSINKSLQPAFTWYSKYHALVSALLLKSRSPSSFEILTKRLPALSHAKSSFYIVLLHRITLKALWSPLLFCHAIISIYKKIFP